MTNVVMLHVPGKENYSGFMKGPKGENLRCNLTPGVHSLPDEKAAQLCRDFPSLFQLEESANPPAPGSSESLSPTTPASSTGSSTPRDQENGDDVTND